MNEVPSGDVRSAIERIREKTTRDASLDEAATWVQLLPYFGGIFGRWIDAIKRDRDSRIFQGFLAVADELDAIRGNLDLTFMDTEGWAAYLEEIAEHMARRREVDKRAYWARLMANLSTPDRPDETTGYRFIDTLDGLRLHHLNILWAMATTEDREDGYQTVHDVWETIRFKLEGVPSDTFALDWLVLEQVGLVNPIPAFDTLVDNPVNRRLSRYGYDFIRSLQRRPAQD